jgi:hypothetical protein
MAGHPSVIKAVEAGSGLSMVPKKAALDSLELGRVKEVKVKELADDRQPVHAPPARRFANTREPPVSRFSRSRAA